MYSFSLFETVILLVLTLHQQSFCNVIDASVRRVLALLSIMGLFMSIQAILCLSTGMVGGTFLVLGPS